MTTRLTVDYDARAAYLRVSDREVVRTVEVAEFVLVDLDAFDVAVGVEVLELDAEIPSSLEREYHIPSDCLPSLNVIKPSVTTFIASHANAAVTAIAPRGTVDRVYC